MRIFIAGATGYIGAALVRACVAAGHEVTGLARDAEKAARVRALGATPLVGDLADPRSLADLGAAHDALIHAASLSGADRAAVDRAAIFALIDSARRAGAPRSVVYTSGIWTLGPTGDTPADESAPAPAPADVSVYRVDLERDVLAASAANVATAVLRPGMVYGGRDGVAGWLADWLPDESGHAGELVVLGNGENRWPVIHLDDLSRAYLAIIERRATGMFHAVEPVPARVIDIATRLAAVSERKLFHWPVADATAKLGPIVQAMTLDQHVVAPRSHALLGWQPQRKPILETVEELWNELEATQRG